MSYEISSSREFYFDEPRLRMTVAGRALIRVITYITYLVLVAASATLLISGIPTFYYLGLFIVLVLLDQWIHRGEGDRAISRFPKSGRVNIAKAFAPQTFLLIGRAVDRSIIIRRPFFLEVAERLLESPEIESGLTRLDVAPKEFKAKLEELLDESTAVAVPETREDIIRKAAALAEQAFEAALHAGHDFVKPEDLFVGLAKMHEEDLARLFELFSITPGNLESAFIFDTSSNSSRRRFGRLPPTIGGFSFSAHRSPIRPRTMQRAWMSRPTPTLDRYSADLTSLACRGTIGFMLGHDDELAQLMTALSRPVNPHAILIGAAGIGKDTIVRHLALRLIKDDTPEELFDRRLVSLDVHALTAGSVTPEEISDSLENIAKEIHAAKNIILYIPNLHDFMKISSAISFLADTSLPIIGASESRDELMQEYEVINVHEVSQADAEKILAYESALLEKEYTITMGFDVVKRAIATAKKHFPDMPLPSSALSLLRSAFVEAVGRGEKSFGPDGVTRVAEEKIHEDQR